MSNHFMTMGMCMVGLGVITGFYGIQTQDVQSSVTGLVLIFLPPVFVYLRDHSPLRAKGDQNG